MTRKKARPQHRENVSPKSANEGGFYKMFWNSMEGDEGHDASVPSPDDLPLNSPTVIVINDSDDENPCTIDDSSGDNYSGIPHPIKQEFLEAQASAREISEDQSVVILSEETIEDGVLTTLQPTSPVKSCTSTALCEPSINSLPPVTDQRTDSENVVRSPGRTDSSTEVCPVSQYQSNVSENNVDVECTVDNSEYLSSLREERISSEPQAISENGHPLAEVSQVCSITSPIHQVDDPPGNDCCIRLGCESVVVNESIHEDKEMSISQHLENSTGAPPALSETTGQALEFLKSLLVSPDEEDAPSSTFVNNDSIIDNSVEGNDNCNESASMNPHQTKGEIEQSQSLNRNVSNHNNQPTVFIPPDQVVSGVVSQPVVSMSNVDLSTVDEPIITDKGESANTHDKDAATDEFPVFGQIVPSKIKIEPSCIKRSLDLLRNELFALYNNCHIKKVFECKTDSKVVKVSGDSSENEEEDFSIPNGTAPCLVMMERLPTPMVRKGYVTLGCKPFQNWKLRIIKQRNEDKFRHLGVWRRGRTRLWRECELAGMDRASYDQQVNYIKKHKISETSSSSEADSSEDESANSSNDYIYDAMFAEAAASSSDESEIGEPTDNHTLCSTPENLNSDNLTNVDVSESDIPKSPTKGKLRGPRSRRYSRVKASNESEVVDHEVLPCRDEYVVERNTVHDDLNSEGKKTAPLKITIRKTSINKSEDEREKSIESEVENGFIVPQKPTHKKIKRTFVTKKTYRKPEEHVPLVIPSVDNDAEKTILLEPPKKRKVQSTPHYIEDNNENEQSLLGRRSHEVENYNLLEKWDIPFEEPTLFRSPRVASRLAQIKTKEAFTRKNYARQPGPQKTVPLCKEVKEVVDLLCSKTVEAMLCPDNLSNSSRDADHVASLEPVTLTPKVQNPVEPGTVSPQHVPTVGTEEAPFKSFCEEDKSETHSNTHEETSSTIDTSECGDSPKKEMEDSQSSKRKKKTKFGYTKRKPKAKPNCKIAKTSSTDEKMCTADILGTKLLPRVMIPPLQSTQVPVVSEGPGQSPQESEDDLIQPKNTEAVSRIECEGKDLGMLSKSQDKTDELNSEKPKLVSPARNTRSKQPAQATESKELISPRLTRSRQPTLTIDPDVLENFGIRKINRKSSSDRKNEASQEKDSVAKRPDQRVKAVQKKKGKTKSSLSKESSSPAARTALEGTKDADSLNTQVHEVSEGPGEVVFDTDETSTSIKLSETLQDNNTSEDKELESIDFQKGTRENPAQVIPDSPMSPTPDEVENESVQPRMTRSKQRMLRAGSAYIAVKKTNASNDDGSLVSDSETKSRVEAVWLEKDPTEKVIATKADSPLAPLDKREIDETVPEKASTGVSEHTTNSKSDPGSTSSVITNESPIVECGEFHSPKLSSDLTEFPQVPSQSSSGVLTHNSTTEVVDTTLLIAKQISDSVALVIHGSENPCEDSLPVSVGGVLEGQEANVKNASPKKSPAKVVSPDLTEGSSSPIDPNTSKERRAVLETLNSILKLSSQNKKISDSLTSAGNNNPFSKREEKKTTELHNVSDDEFDSGDATGDLVVDEDRDFSDDDDNSADLASRIDQIIKDQITSDNEPPPSGASGSMQTDSSKTASGKENNRDSSGKRRDSIDERTGLPTVLMQKLRDPRIRSKIMSRLEDADDSIRSETTQNRPSPKDAITSTKAALPDTPALAIRDPRGLRNGTMVDPRQCVETPVTIPGSALASSMVLNDETASGALSNIPTVVRGAATVLPSTANPTPALRGATISTGTYNLAAISRGAANPAVVLRGTLNSAAALRGVESPATNLRGAITPTISGAVSSTPIPRGPLLPTPTALLPTRTALLPTPTALLSTITALRDNSAAIHPTLANPKTAATLLNESGQPNKADEVDDDEEESLKRRPKKQKKEIDTELMYKSPLEDLQSEARPAYGRNPPRRNPRIERRSFPRTDRGMHDVKDTRPSRWDVRYTDRRPERDNPCYSESLQSYNQDRWGKQQVNEHITQNPTDVYPWKQNWYPEYNARPNDVIQEPKLSYMDTHLLNLSLLPKTTNLNCPPFTKIYTYFNHGNPQILGVAPPTYDPKEKASTITMLDPMGQEMIDIVQLPRPTSGLTSDYFNDLPDEFSLEELVSHPYLALSDMMDEEVEIEHHGTNIFDDSDEERKIVMQASKRHINDPRNRSILIEKTDNIKNKDPKKSVVKDDPLENILHCLPALKEQYAFKKSQAIPEGDLWGNDSDKLIPPPPPTWSTESSLGDKAKQSEKIPSTLEEDTPTLESWRNPSPPKRKAAANNPRSPTRRKSRSKSPSHRSSRRRSRSISPPRRRSKSRSPGRWRRSRSRSPYCKGSRTPSTPGRRSRSRSISPAYRSAYGRRSRSRSRGRARSRERSRSRSLERLGRVRRHKRSRSRSPAYSSSRSSTSISPSRKRHSRR